MAERDRANNTATIPLVFVEISGRMWATELGFVREVVPERGIGPMPNAVSAVEGIMNLRGEIVPVIRTSMIIDGLDSIRSKGKVMVIELQGAVIGLLVDTVHRVELVPAKALTPCDPASAEDGPTGHIKWMLQRDRGQPIPVLDLAELLGGLGMRMSGRNDSVGPTSVSANSR